MLEILNSGVEEEIIQRKAAEAKFSKLSRRLQLYMRVHVETQLAYHLLSNVDDTCQNPLPSLIVPADESFIVDATRMVHEARVAEKEVAQAANPIETENEQQLDERLLPKIQHNNLRILVLSRSLIQIRVLAIAKAIAHRAEADLSVNEARLAHEESIFDSQVNDVAWRTEIRSEAAFLDQYEQGGFSSSQRGRHHRDRSSDCRRCDCQQTTIMYHTLLARLAKSGAYAIGIVTLLLAVRGCYGCAGNVESQQLASQLRQRIAQYNAISSAKIAAEQRFYVSSEENLPYTLSPLPTAKSLPQQMRKVLSWLASWSTEPLRPVFFRESRHSFKTASFRRIGPSGTRNKNKTTPLKRW